MNPRETLLHCLRAALEAVRGDRVVAAHLAANPLPRPGALIAVGKAAPAMAAGALSHWPDVPGLIVTKHGHADEAACARLPCLEAGHPIPDAASLRAGELVRRAVAEAPRDAPLLFLLSGGTSVLMEALPEGVTLRDLTRVNRWLLGAGLPIDQVNAVRQRLSCLKAGRLARVLDGRRAVQLIISDVPGDRAAVIGSAPLVPVSLPPLPVGLPAWLVGLLDRAPAPLAADEAAAGWVQTALIADNARACAAAAEAGAGFGLAVYRHDAPLAGEAGSAGERLAQTLLEGPPGLHVWGGETTVTLPARPGRGGRNQHLALAAARRLQGHAGVYLLAAGTDGTDGPTGAAGALVDGDSVARAADDGRDVAAALRAADAGTYLEGSGDLIDTGPTGSNVMDLVLGLRLA